MLLAGWRLCAPAPHPYPCVVRPLDNTTAPHRVCARIAGLKAHTPAVRNLEQKLAREVSGYRSVAAGVAVGKRTLAHEKKPGVHDGPRAFCNLAITTAAEGGLPRTGRHPPSPQYFTSQP
jgi:hypothetical protein